MEVYQCTTCGGMVLEPDELIASLGTEPSYSPLSDVSDRTPCHCFRCSIDMVPVEDSDGRVFDRCEICKAVFATSHQV
jgi:hypothetical protein